jgi:hypothetical protein
MTGSIKMIKRGLKDSNFQSCIFQPISPSRGRQLFSRERSSFYGQQTPNFHNFPVNELSSGEGIDLLFFIRQFIAKVGQKKSQFEEIFCRKIKSNQN